MKARSELEDCIRLLKIAREEIKNNEGFLVCASISMAVADKYREDFSAASVDRWDKAREYLDSWITLSLDNKVTVRSWLVSQGIRDSSISTDDLRYYRMAWIDNMIEELEKD